MMNYARIIGTGSALPETKISNQDLVFKLAHLGVETSDEWIKSRTGIESRYFAGSHEKTSDLATAAAQQAIFIAKIDKQIIDLIIVATSTPDHLNGFPSTACIVQAKLGIKSECAAFDLQAVCSGFIYAFIVAQQFIASGMYSTILVIGAEIFSRLINFQDRRTCVLFGDGAGAVLLSAQKNPGIIASAMQANGDFAPMLCVPATVADGQLQGQAYLQMNGRFVFENAVKKLTEVSQTVLEKANVSSSAVDWLLLHQANIRILWATAKKLNIAQEKIIMTLDQHGNTSAASIPLALDHAVRSGKIYAGQSVLLAGVGGGFTWGGSLIRI